MICTVIKARKGGPYRLFWQKCLTASSCQTAAETKHLFFITIYTANGESSQQSSVPIQSLWLRISTMQTSKGSHGSCCFSTISLLFSILFSIIFYTVLYFSHPMIILLKCLHHFSFVTKSVFWFHTWVHWRGCMHPLPMDIGYHRVLNDFQRTRLSRLHRIWLLPHLLPPSSPVSKLDRRHTGRLRKRDNFLTGEWGTGGGAKSYEGEKAWSSINICWISTKNVRMSALQQSHFWSSGGVLPGP